MYWTLRVLNPRWFGNSVRSSAEMRSMTLVPHFSSSCRARMVRPISQYMRSISVLTFIWTGCRQPAVL